MRKTCFFLPTGLTIIFVQIIWQKKEPPQSPYLLRQRAEWNGLTVSRARVIPGRLLEHEVPFHEININISGGVTTERITATGRRKTVRGATGGLCITPAGQVIGAHWSKTLDYLGMFLNPDFAVQVAVENRFSPAFNLKDDFTDRDPLVESIGLALLAESQNDLTASRLYADSLINALTIHLLKNYSDAHSAPENLNGGLSGYKLRRVEEFISANLEADLSLADIAEIADLSQFHFARAFRKSKGLTPQQYLMRCRIERAKELLTNADLPLVEISLRTGFKNQSHFNTLFRKFTKFTPKTWRELKLA